MPETSRAIASASSSVRYERLPIVEREERSGKTIMKLLPKEDICSSMLLFAPAPTAKAGYRCGEYFGQGYHTGVLLSLISSFIITPSLKWRMRFA